MRRILALALFTFNELVRSKLLVIWVLGVVVLSGLSFLLSILSYGEVLSIFMDLGLVGMEVSGILVLLLGLAVTYTTEMDQKAVFLHLCKPLTKGEYLMGRVLGFYLTISIVVLGMGAVVGALVLTAGGSIPALYLDSVLFMLLEMWVLTVLGLAFQMIATSMVGTVLYCAFTILLGHLTGEIQWLLGRQLGPFLKDCLQVVYYCLPNLEVFNLKDRLYDPTLVLGSAQWEEVLLYAFAYSAVVFLLGWWNLEKREFM